MVWFATDVDRCFETGAYGNGVRFYSTDLDDYIIITGVKFENGILTVKSGHNIFTINSQPNISFFKYKVYSSWKAWDRKNGLLMGEDRRDYKPWMYSSLYSLASDLLSFKYDCDKFVNDSDLL
jgi:hypothetical protein